MAMSPQQYENLRSLVGNTEICFDLLKQIADSQPIMSDDYDKLISCYFSLHQYLTSITKKLKDEDEKRAGSPL